MDRKCCKFYLVDIIFWVKLKTFLYPSTGIINAEIYLFNIS